MHVVWVAPSRKRRPWYLLDGCVSVRGWWIMDGSVVGDRWVMDRRVMGDRWVIDG